MDDAAKEGTHYSRIVTTVSAADLNNFLGVTTEDVAAGLANGINGNLDSPFAASSNGTLVNVAGPAFTYSLGTPYTTATVTLGGKAAEGEVWALVVNGRTWSTTVAVADIVAGDDALTIANVAGKLRGLIDADPALVGGGSGAVITVTPTTGLVSVGFLVSGASAGTAAVTGTHLGAPGPGYTVDPASELAWNVAEIDIGDGGTPAPAGAVWTVNLDGLEFQYTRKSTGAPAVLDTLDGVAAGLANAINQSGTRFATKYATATVKLSGAPHAGDVWSFQADGATFSYTVLAGDTLISVTNALASAVHGLADYDVNADVLTDSQFTFERADGESFAVKLSVNGVNLQSAGQVTGTTVGDKLIVFTTDGTPFTVNVRLAQSASQVDGFAVGGVVLDPGAGIASERSTTHYSKLVLELATAALPVAQGAGWNLDVGVRPDRVALDFSGTPTAGEVLDGAPERRRLDRAGQPRRAGRRVAAGRHRQPG